MTEFSTVEELTMDRDGSKAYRYADSAVSSAMAQSWNSATTDVESDISWVVEDETEDAQEVVITVAALDVLWSKAREYDRLAAVCVHMPCCECE